MARPLHERIRSLIPQSVKDVVPESIKEKIRPPAWRDPVVETPEWAKSEGKTKWTLGAPATTAGQIAVEQDAKGYPLPAPVSLPEGLYGKITAVGPTWVVFQPNSHAVGYRVYNPNTNLNPLLPENERKWGRLVEVSAEELDA